MAQGGRTRARVAGMSERDSQPTFPASNLAMLALSIDNVARWLEHGCDQKYAALELRVIAKKLGSSPETADYSCPVCKGRKRWPDAAHECPNCGGNGLRRTAKTKCKRCGDTGEVETGEIVQGQRETIRCDCPAGTGCKHILDAIDREEARIAQASGVTRG